MKKTLLAVTVLFMALSTQVLSKTDSTFNPKAGPCDPAIQRCL